MILTKRLLLIPLLLFALVLGAAPATAGPPQEAAGEWTYVVDLPGLEFRPAGRTLFITGTEESTFTGTFTGTAHDEFVVVCHDLGDGDYMSYAKIWIYFTGEVDGRHGDLTMMATGKQYTETCNPSEAIWNGRWVIVGGTGELADLHGQGTWTGPSFFLDYTGRIHFD